MKIIILGLVSVLVTSAGAWASGGHTADSQPAKAIADYRELSADEQLVQKLLDTYGRAMEERSIPVAEQAVIPNDFSTIESGYANWTWQDFKENHLAVELETFKNIDYQMELLTGELQGDLGFAIYRYTATGTLVSNDQSVSITGLATAILEKTDQGWRIHHIHSSTPRQAQSAAEH